MKSNSSRLYELELEDVVFESKDRAESQAMDDLRVYGVDRTDGLTPDAKYASKNLGRYKVLKPAMFAYNPMRLNIGSIAYCTEKHRVGLVSPDYVVFGCRKDKLDPGYFRYYIKGPAWRNWTTAAGVGSVRVRIYFRELARMPIALPPLAEQKAIAAVLRVLDDKIELNRRMNATLEAMVRALFQSWFVDFDPVRAKLDARPPTGLDPATSALFPDHLEDSPLGHIPNGWTAGRLGDIGANSRRGIQPSEIAPNTRYIALEHMPRRCIALGDWDESADVASGKSAFKKGEILFGKLRPYFHKVGVAPFDGVCSTDILVLAPKSPEWFGFLLGHASSDALVQFTDLASTGTKMPRTNWNDISSFKVALPPKPIAAAFTKLIQPMLDRIHANLHQSRTLATLRDTLLPMLLSGELRVVGIKEQETA